MSQRPVLRLDSKNVLRCTERRKRGIGLECDTPIARPVGGRLVIKCRNCHTDHVFVAVDGQIVYLPPPDQTCRLPVDAAVS